MIEFICDKIDISKKRVDGSRDVIITVGEYQQEKLLPILILKEGNYKVRIEDSDE
jgi:hypothetical protein